MPEIITQFNSNLHTSWQKELANVVTDPQKLLKMLDLDIETYQSHFKARQLFPVRVPMPFVQRMEKGNINDPLLMQVMPREEEFVEQTGYFTDPLEEHDTVAEGLLHKYKHRVLMIVKAGCAVNCRYCFRRHFPYQDNSPNKLRWHSALNYIKDHSEINEVIFSGGDPLMANDDHLNWLITQLETIEHVKRLRIHTRLPVVIPQRLTHELINTLVKSRLKVTTVLHINHPNEIDQQLMDAVELLRQVRIPVFNQSTLLKGVNDDADTLCQLSERLFDNGVQPYYLHVFDKVQGAAHFDLPRAEVTQLVKQMMATLPGFLMPKVVSEIAGEASKTPFAIND